MIQRIGHIALMVEDMERSLHFYCDVLGLQRAFDVKNEKGEPMNEYIKVGGLQFIELFYGGTTKSEVKPRQIGYSHLCLDVESIHQIADRLKAHHIPLDMEPRRGKDYNLRCWAKDPDGNRIEFVQLDERSPHMNC